VLIFVRHGESDHNAAGRLVGRSDPPLTERGVRQASACGRLLAKGTSRGRTALLVTSPLRRAVATAEAVAAELGADVSVDHRLVELDYGELEGVKITDVGPETWSAWRADPSWRPGRGETLLAVHERLSAFCEENAELASHADVVAVSHVSPVKAAACWAMGAGPAVTWRLSLPVASVTRIATKPPALRSFGETAHLLEHGLLVDPPPGREVEGE
jgi:probable phosphoglycerate mutase